jgi:hypothetical protein
MSMHKGTQNNQQLAKTSFQTYKVVQTSNMVIKIIAIDT